MTTKTAALSALAGTGIAPRGLSRVQAAAYIGISPTLFDTLVADGTMPAPRRINSRAVWDLRDLDRAFDNLPRDGSARQDDADVWDQARA